MNTGVYTITNLVNGKMYVGSTTNSFYERGCAHFRSLEKQVHPNMVIQRAYNKYGVENLVFEVLEECLPEYCESTEQFWMNMLQTFDKKYGYNLRPTAKSNAGFRHSEETKKRIGEGNKGKVISEETCNKMSISLKSDPSRMEHIRNLGKNMKKVFSPERLQRMSDHMYEYNNSLSEEQKKQVGLKISNKLKGVSHSKSRRINQARSRGLNTIHLYDKDGAYIESFSFMKDASSFLDCNTDSIRKAIKYNWLLFKKYVLKRSETPVKQLQPSEIPIFNHKWLCKR